MALSEFLKVPVPIEAEVWGFTFDPIAVVAVFLAIVARCFRREAGTKFENKKYGDVEAGTASKNKEQAHNRLLITLPGVMLLRL